jgi:DNA polymerase I
MEFIFQLFDCDYVNLDNKPVVRLFGKSDDGKTVCAFYKDYLPYFYVLLKTEEKDLVDFLEKKFPNLIVKIKEVEKFLPIGFQEKKTKLYKITLKDPSQTPVVREELWKQTFIKDIYEADILFKYRFLADHGLSGMKWVKVSGESGGTTTVKSHKMITAKKIEPIEQDTNVPLKYMSIDIEIIPSKDKLPDSRHDQIIMMSMSFFPAFDSHNTLVLVAKIVGKKERDVLVFNNEREMLEEFLKIVEEYDPDVITGYNINNFDMPYILERLTASKLPRFIGRCNQKPAMTRKFGMKTKNTVTGRVVVDVYELIKESVGKGLLRLKRYGLGDVSKELLGEGKVDIAHSEIEKHWSGNEQQLSKLIEYSRKDAELALKLLLNNNMIDKFIELSKVSGMLLQDVLDGGEATRVENLLLREFNKKDFVIPCKPNEAQIRKSAVERETKGLKGALVLEPSIGLHTNDIVYLDFRSMYPSIFMAYNICPTTLIIKETKNESNPSPGVNFVSPSVRKGIVPAILEEVLASRAKVRKEMAEAKDKNIKNMLGAKQYALKIMANAFYGYTGYVRARFYVLDIASAITSCGRELIQRTKSIVEHDETMKVVYGDTDSIMVKLQTKNLDEAFKIGAEIEQRINKELTGIVSIKIESVFKTLLVLAKKRYAGLSCEKVNGQWKEEIVMKGIETVRRDWCDLTSKTLYGILDILLKEQNTKKAFQYVREVLGRLDRNEIPIEDLVITKSVSKSLKEYKGTQPHIELVKKMKQRTPAEAPGIGDRVGFVIVKGLQLMSDRAEHPDYIKQHGLKIDSKYYVESQILPPLERVFEAIGISKSELIGFGKQMLLTDAIRNGIRNDDTPLKSIDGFICKSCQKTYTRVPLIGKCVNCNGEILFYSGDRTSKFFSTE